MSDRGGGLTRDIILRVKAENLSTATFTQATAAVNQLTAALDKQMQAAARGDIKEKELTETLTKLQNAAKTFAETSSQIKVFEGFESRIKAAEAALANAGTKLEEFRQKNGDGELATRKLQNELERLERTFGTMGARLATLRNQQTQYGEKLAQSGIDVNNLAQAEQHLTAATNQAAASIQHLTDFKANYARITREVAAALKAQKAAEDEVAAAERARVEAHQQAQQQLITERRGSYNTELQEQIKVYNDQRAAERKVIEDEKARIKERQDVQVRANAINQDLALQRIQAELKARRKAIDEGQNLERRAESERSLTQATEAHRLEQERVQAAEAQRRADLGITGRLREDYSERKRIRDEEREATRAAAKEEAETQSTKRKKTQEIGVFGLPAYQATNLGYQATDVVQGFLSGVNPGVIAAQQGPQIFQIFGMAALKWLPLVGAAAAAAAVAFGTLSRAMSEATATRDFTATLATNVNAIDYTTDALVKLRKEAHDMGMSYADANAVIKEGVGGNIAAARLKQFVQLSQDLAEVWGGDVKDKAKILIDGFDGTEAGINRLNQAFKFLDDPMRQDIHRMIEAGQAQEAMLLVVDRLSARERAAAEQRRGPGEQAVKNFSKAWDDLLDTLGKSEFMQAEIKGLTVVVGWLDKAITGFDNMITRLNEYNKIRSMPENQTSYDPLVGVPVYRGMPGAAPAPSGDGRFSSGSLKIDTDTLKTLSTLLAQASQQLPPGYRVEAISTERPGAKIAGTNTPSEHGYGRAIDVRIVDAKGQAVPGSMGTGGPLYQQLDAAMLEAAKKLNVGPLAIGSTFSNRADAGHYSLGGSEAASNAARRGEVLTTAPPQAQSDAAEKANRAARQDLAIKQATTDLARREAEYVKAIEVAREKGGTQAQQDQAVRNRMSEVDNDILKDRLQREADARRLETDHVKDIAKIKAAGDKSVEDAQRQARGTLGQADIETIRKRGESEEADRLAREDAEQKRLDASRDKLAIDSASSEQARRQAELAKVTREERDRNSTKEQQDQQIIMHMREFDNKLLLENLQRESELGKQAVDNAKHLNEMRAAGVKAAEAAQTRAGGTLGYRDLETIRKRAEADEGDRLARLDSQNDKLKQAVKIVTDLGKASDTVFKTDLEKRLDAITQKYKDLAEQIKKSRDDSPLIDPAKFNEQLEKLPALEAREKGRETGNALMAQLQAAATTRKDLIDSYKHLRELGVISIQEEEDKIKGAFDLTTKATNDSIAALEKWLETADKLGLPADEIEKTRAKMAELKAEAVQIDPFLKGLTKTIEESFTNRAAEAFNTVAEAIGGVIAKTKDWKDVWSSLRSAAANFFAGILKDIANYIIKAQLAKLVSSFMPGAEAALGVGAKAATSAATTAASGAASATGALGGAAASGSSGGFFSWLFGSGGTAAAAAVIHAGGVVGVTQLPQRNVSWFDRAPRYHTGGVVGLAANEQAAILQRGEEVLTADNPRNMRNMTNNVPRDINIRNVLVADPELVPQHMASSRGEKIIMSTLTRNAATVRQLVR
jgi:hypothetical protein